MNWLNAIVDELLERRPEDEILIESGSSPSGTYHLGHLRELVICDAILLEVRRRGRTARHIQFVDDLDALRKLPINIPKTYETYLGQPLSDIPAPDESDRSYGDYFLQTLTDACDALNIEVTYVRASEKYRQGFYVPAIEKSLEKIDTVRNALETVAGRQLDEHWSPIQVLEDGRLKKRKFIRINTESKTLTYATSDGQEKQIAYDKGEVKLDWRLDWPGRWWLQHVAIEPSGRDHMTKGGSYDTGVQIMREVYGAEPPMPVSYDFINMAGDTKKMSASKGTGLDAVEGATIMPPEVVRYFILKNPPLKRLYFDPINGVVQLMDEFAAFAAKTDKTDEEEQLWYLATRGNTQRRSVARVPFSHVVASYQASLKDADRTIEVIKRTEHSSLAEEDADIIRSEIRFIDSWLQKRAPEEVKFELLAAPPAQEALNEKQRAYLRALADKIERAPQDADGEWFHKAIYGFKESMGIEAKELFTTLYQVLIGKSSGPRAGWFLSLLPRDWLIQRLRLQA